MRVLAIILAAAAWSAAAAPAMADQVCVTSAYEVAWVHPGVTMFLDTEEGACAGESITLKEGEHGCFVADAALDGSHFLSALDAVTSKCRPVCAIEQADITLLFHQSRAYACGG